MRSGSGKITLDLEQSLPNVDIFFSSRKARIMDSDTRLFSAIASKRNEIEPLLVDALRDGLQKVANYESAGGVVGNYTEWPTINIAHNGLPRITNGAYAAPKNYRALFTSFLGVVERKIDVEDLPPYSTYLEYIVKTPELLMRFVPEKAVGTESEASLLSSFAISGVYTLINRYVHILGSWEKLPIDIVIPVLCTNFQFESQVVAKNIELRRLTDKEHLARYRATGNHVSVHNEVLASATHALVLKNWEVKNTELVFNFNTLTAIQAYPVEMINRFFAAFRIVSDIPIGYAQIVALANSWLIDPAANLPQMHGVTTRSYPASFEYYYWNTNPVPMITAEQMADISKVFKDLENANENSLSLSTRRLNRCLVRESEEDSVLDVTIALEALLASDGNQEMTHKLALRVGALVGIGGDFDRSPKQAFADIKNIYKYRSAIVHGSHTVDKKRMVSIDEKEKVPAQQLAIHYLRYILKVLIEFPEYRKPEVIDQKLLLGYSDSKGHEDTGK